MTGQEKRLSSPRLWLLGILVSFLILGFAYSIVIPLAETPDESEHFRYMQAIAISGQLPIMEPEREANVTLEAHQPPLYYSIGALFFRNFDLNPEDNPPDNPCFSFLPSDPGRKTAYLHNVDEWPPQRDVYRAFYFMRWLSVVMGAITVWLAYIIGGKVVPTLTWFGPAAAAVLAFNPQFIFSSSSVNNDVPTTLIGAIVVALSIRAVKRPRFLFFGLLGIVTGLGMLTKFALIAFWPLALLAVFWSTIEINRSPLSIKVTLGDLIGRAAAVIFLPLLTAGWWYWRNYRLYGDPLMWDVTLAAKGSVIARTAPFALADFFEFLSLHFQSYWIWFGWLNIKAPNWVYGLFLLVFLSSILGIMRFIIKRNVPVVNSALAFNALAILTIYASLGQYIQSINWTGYQGRLAFAAAVPISVFLVLGLAALGGKKIVLLTAGGFGAASIAALFFILMPAYPRPQIFQPQGEVIRTCARFAEGLQVEAFSSSDSVNPGEILPVMIYGYGLADSFKPQSMELTLTGVADREIGKAMVDLSWQPGQVVETRIDLPVAEDAQPARGILSLAMIGTDGQNQTAASAADRQLTIPFPLGTIKVKLKDARIPAPDVSTNANFGGQLSLVGYDLDELGAGQYAITLYWLALEKMNVDFTTFIHVLDKDGQLVAQYDSQPTEGTYPTSIWDKGEIVADQKVIDYSLSGNEGRLQLAAGVYLLDTLERLPVWNANGDRQANDQLILESIEP